MSKRGVRSVEAQLNARRSGQRDAGRDRCCCAAGPGGDCCDSRTHPQLPARHAGSGETPRQAALPASNGSSGASPRRGPQGVGSRRRVDAAADALPAFCDLLARRPPSSFAPLPARCNDGRVQRTTIGIRDPLAAPDDTQETFISHLVELRSRLLHSIVAVVDRAAVPVSVRQGHLRRARARRCSRRCRPAAP